MHIRLWYKYTSVFLRVRYNFWSVQCIFSVVYTLQYAGMFSLPEFIVINYVNELYSQSVTNQACRTFGISNHSSFIHQWHIMYYACRTHVAINIIRVLSNQLVRPIVCGWGLFWSSKSASGRIGETDSVWMGFALVLHVCKWQSRWDPFHVDGVYSGAPHRYCHLTWVCYNGTGTRHLRKGILECNQVTIRWQGICINLG